MSLSGTRLRVSPDWIVSKATREGEARFFLLDADQLPASSAQYRISQLAIHVRLPPCGYILRYFTLDVAGDS